MTVVADGLAWRLVLPFPEYETSVGGQAAIIGHGIITIPGPEPAG